MFRDSNKLLHDSDLLYSNTLLQIILEIRSFHKPLKLPHLYFQLKNLQLYSNSQYRITLSNNFHHKINYPRLHNSHFLIYSLSLYHSSFTIIYLLLLHPLHLHFCHLLLHQIPHHLSLSTINDSKSKAL